ncbi:MAG TPA: prephenate dehydratase [Candidatus Hydrogenedentes bacterium]|nr:prephenate dehydratase [Candidatus Hydrogenedentota bacterium]HOT51808.1 prephenate dehydratase [Candidatus Hydrogenedentota bacterium]HOV72887.1 prephenate dehydratase [Candidatus Hydrogenedentota bacterium]HPC16424.1 prephenate dehydratase [Candidatus Hydrogenedentota bacterium]HRT20357.1 prephenate dehydratase [Candidatus Hydrogenedentota bacterium]
MTLDELRTAIDELDSRILELLSERAKRALEIAEIKRSTQSAYYVPEREKAVFERLRALNRGPLPDSAIRVIYREVMSAIRSLEKNISVAYLGPNDTFSHMAALRVFGVTADYHPLPTVADIFTEVERKRIDYGLVPVESSMGGGVHDTLDRFISSDLKIVNEVLLRITQNLLSNSPMDKIERVYSKDNAFIQCRNWLRVNLPNAKLIDVSSTAEAARIASQEAGAAAVASALAAKTYNVDILVPSIEDSPNNYTRFFVMGRQLAKPTGKDKTSILISIKDRPGALYSLLTPFNQSDVNLTRIESRPSRRKAWEYVFFIDLIGHIDDPRISEVLEKVHEYCVELKVLGSYPQGDVEE